MEIVFVVVIGVTIGALVRYLVPGRTGYGIALLPAVSGAVTIAVWVGLVWLGWAFDGGWIWVASLGAGTLVSILLAALLPRRRREADTERFAQLARAGSASTAG